MWHYRLSVSRLNTTGTPTFFPAATAIILIMILSSCGFPGEWGSKNLGILSLSIDAEDSAGTRSLTPSIYVFSGEGPDGESFSVIVNESIAAVEGLRTGDWLVCVEGLDEKGCIVLAGETFVYVEPGDVTPVYIVLTPKDGEGSVTASVSWNALQTASPSVEMTVTGADGESDTVNLSINEAGCAEGSLGNLPVGYYHVALRLFDSGILVTGSAWTVRVLNEAAVEVSAQFEDLNRIAEGIELAEDSFTLAWEDESDEDVTEEYRVYVRNHGEQEWTFLCTVPPAEEPQLTVNVDLLSYGSYEFAVSEVVEGDESDLHTSLDDSAQPSWGWYLNWTGV